MRIEVQGASQERINTNPKAFGDTHVEEKASGHTHTQTHTITKMLALLASYKELL